MVVYYTIISNLVCLAFFFVVFFSQIFGILKENSLYYATKLAITIDILITMIAFELIVRPYVYYVAGYSSNNIRDTIVHLIVPIMVFMDYILFDKKKNLKFSYIPVSFILPVFYAIFVFFYSHAGGTFRAFKQISNYPYVFMNFEKYGNITFGFYAAILAVFAIIGCLIVYIDKKCH
jgi:hypothetical protein